MYMLLSIQFQIQGKRVQKIFENAPFVLHLYGVPLISYSCGVPSVPYLYAAPLLLYPVFSYLVFVYLFIASPLDYEYAAPLVSYLYIFIVIILCCIFVFLFTYMPLTFVEVHVCSAPDLCIFSFEILFQNTVRCRHILLL